MKILQIIPSLHGGGAEKFTIDLCNELSKEHEVVLCSLFDVEEHMFMQDQLNDTIKVITLGKKLGLDFSIFTKIFKLIKSEKPDVVNTHLRALFYSALPIVMKKSKFFHTVHNVAKNETGKSYRTIYKVFFKYFNVTPIGISNEIQKSIISTYDLNSVPIIDNGVLAPHTTNQYDTIIQEIDNYKIDINTKVFLTIGRISEQKNHTMLIDVFNSLLKKQHNVVLLIIGEDYSEEKKLKNMLVDKANTNIHFLGMKNNIADYLAGSDAFCLSSLYEGLPITLLEALAMGTIPICTPAGGIVDVLTDDIGFVSKGFTADDYKKEIIKFIDMSNSQKNKMSEQGEIIFKQNYAIAITAMNYLNLYNNEKIKI